MQGLPVGGVILNYLLEKSRVVRHADGEENFHVFYELIYGADTSLLDTLRLTQDTDDYRYTQVSPVCLDCSFGLFIMWQYFDALHSFYRASAY